MGVLVLMEGNPYVQALHSERHFTACLSKHDTYNNVFVFTVWDLASNKYPI